MDYHVNDCESYLGDICDDVREREVGQDLAISTFWGHARLE